MNKETKKVHKEYLRTKRGKKSFTNIMICGAIAVLAFIGAVIFQNNENMHNVLLDIEIILVGITLCFYFYYIGGLMEFKYNRNKK